MPALADITGYTERITVHLAAFNRHQPLPTIGALTPKLFQTRSSVALVRGNANIPRILSQNVIEQQSRIQSPQILVHVVVLSQFVAIESVRYI